MTASNCDQTRLTGALNLEAKSGSAALGEVLLDLLLQELPVQISSQDGHLPEFEDIARIGGRENPLERLTLWV